MHSKLSIIIFLYFYQLSQVHSKTCDDLCSNVTDLNRKPGCFCTDCDIYNDCCQDRQLPVYTSKIYKCNVRLSEVEMIYSVSKCDKNWHDLKIKNKCENPQMEIENNMMNHVPVYSNLTNTTYRNAYCAKCNHENLNMFTIRLFVFEPTPTRDMNESDERITELAVKEFLNRNKVGKPMFTYRFLEPIPDLKLRRCINAIDTCPSNSSQELKQACSNSTAYRSYIKNGKVTYFKNEYCAKCNGIQENFLKCMIQKGFTDGRKSVSLQVLFDLTGFQDDIVEISIQIRSSKGTTSIHKSKLISYGLNSTNSSMNNTDYCLTDDLNSLSSTSDIVKKYLTIIGNIISIICLFLLLFLYFSNKVLRNLPGKILICLSLSLLFSQLFFLFGNYLAEPNLNLCYQLGVVSNRFDSFKILLNEILQSSFYCYFFGMGTHYFYLCFFTWSNIMAYDLYKMLTVLNSNKKGKIEADSKYKFLKYSMYSWLIPLFVISLLISSQFLFNKMAYGYKKCFISNTTDLFVFFMLPVVIILLTNVVFLVISIRSIREIDTTTKKYLNSDTADTSETIVMKSSSRNIDDDSVGKSDKRNNFKKNLNNQDNSSNKKRLILFIKLFILTGMTWITGLIPSFTGLSFVWYIYIVLNSLQGLFIFFSFAFNPQTRREFLRSKLYQRLSSSFHNSTSSSSQLIKKRNNNSSLNNTTSTSLSSKHLIK